MSLILEASNLTKVFQSNSSPSGEFVAIDNVSFSIKEGEVLGLLGPNGAGKTTTIQMLLGLITATSGKIRYFGKDFPQNREYILSRINFASTYSQVQRKITVWQNLRIYAGLYGMAEIERICDRVMFLKGGKIVAEDTPLGLTKKSRRLLFDSNF